jgi:ribosome-binding factor A
MDSRRQLKIASVIKEAFTQILLREGRSIYGGSLVTVTNVKVTSDLTLVRFYLSIYNTPTPDAIIENFEAKKHELKRWLAEKLRHDLRRIPEIEFFKDETLDQVFHMEEVFKKIREEESEIEKLKLKKKPAVKRASKKSAS